jgi:stearoyl-CoA desaturase (delta-9 desaturase)
LLSHRSWESPKWFEYVGSLLGTLGGTGSTIAWVAAHRKHHRYSDVPGDPHSPHTQSWWKVQWFSMFESVQLSYVKDLLRSPWHNGLHRGYFSWHALYALTLGFTLGWWYLIPMWLAPAAVLWNAGSLINTVCHMHGKQPFETNDQSRNVWWLGMLVWGEGYHNNHHKFPRNARFGLESLQFDASYQVIRLLRERT